MTMGTYIAVTFNKKTCKKLFKLCKKLKVPNPVDNFHSTLIFSKKPVPITREIKNVSYFAWTKKLEVWKDHDKNILVLTISSPQMVQEHNKYISMGCTTDFKDFNQHITLSYDIGDWEFLNNFFMGFQLETKTLYIEDLEV